VLYERIPYASEQGIFCRLAGNWIRRSRNFWRDQGRRGVRDRPPGLLSCLAADHRRTLGPANLSGRAGGGNL